MRYMCVKAEGTDGNFSATYYVSYNSLLGKSDIYNYVGTLALKDLMYTLDDEDDYDNIDAGFELNDEAITSEEFDYCLLEYERVRERVRMSVLGFPQKDIFVCYQLCDRDMTEVPRYIVASASCGQDASVRSLGCVDVDTPFEEEYDRLRNDCLYQLKKYTDTPSVLLATGVLCIEELDEEEYQTALDDEELVLA